MIGAWMGYAFLVSLLLGVGAYLLERSGSLVRRSRWIWVGAIGGSLLLPLVVRILVGRRLPASGEGTEVGEVGGIEAGWAVAPAMDAGAGGLQVASEWLVAMEPWLRGGWLVLSMGLVALALLSMERLRRAARGWPEGEVAGQPVRISRGTGPAVFGFFRQTIVVPAWVLMVPEEERRMIIAHEREHVRAGDHRLVLAALTMLFLLPWNVPLWWMMRRLRQAVEIDCDARVVAGGADPRAYGAVLLRVGAGRAGPLLVSTALTEPSSNLERRIEMIAKQGKVSVARRVLPAGAAVLLVAVACVVDQPRPVTPTAPGVVEPESPAAARLASEEPTFTPHDVRPELIGAANARTIIAEHYPPALRDAGIEGTPVLWVLVDRTGSVTRTGVARGSGRAELDEAAQAAMRQLRFTPARHRSEPVPVWIQLPVRFSAAAPPAPAAGGDAPPTPARAPAPAATPAPPAAPSPQAAPAPAAQTRPAAAPVALEPPPAAPAPAVRPAPPLTTAPPPPPAPASPAVPSPTFTPYDTRPELLNRREFGEAMHLRYPPVLRDAGVGGTVVLWVYIDRDGTVGGTRVGLGSGHALLDAAASDLMRQARFAPARLEGSAVPVWIQLPVTFQPPAAS